MLLAAGAMPSMTIAPRRSGLRRARRRAAGQSRHLRSRSGGGVARSRSTARQQGSMPWVLDPVFIDRSPPRAAFAKRAGRREAARRCGSIARNSRALAGGKPDERALARLCARARAPSSALTGETDLVTRRRAPRRHRQRPSADGAVTAMGCAGSALVAACLAVEPDAWRATAAALIVIGVAGEIAAAARARARQLRGRDPRCALRARPRRR